ncbi:MAG: DNA methyltransferase, partial [Nostocaceae cyanobacterium]|nr:DNA methyltransferase [Nostocaceae cyanobacterium]
MTIDFQQSRQLLQEFKFNDLFVYQLGWENPPARDKAVPMTINGLTYHRQIVAELLGAVIVEITGEIPNANIRKEIYTEIAQLIALENLIIFTDKDRFQSIWYWVKREGTKTYPREQVYFKHQQGDLLLGKISALKIPIEELEAGNLSVIDIAERLQRGFDVERVTKRFFDDFAKQHSEFLSVIQGIHSESDRRWYTSVILNRLMFVYFLQRKGFLDNNEPWYLQKKLQQSRERGEDRFYREFLQALFFEGFAKPENQRSPEAKTLIGKIKYLNGGLFLKHPIEQQYPHITIPDGAFEKIFKLFEGYSWNLDDSIGGKDNEINPAVLGYIFEKYINQKAFGAYYTRPEITEYLCDRTINKLILDRVNEISCRAGILPANDINGAGILPANDINGAGNMPANDINGAGNMPANDINGAGKIPTPQDKKFESITELLTKLDANLCRHLINDILPNLSLLDPACGSGAFLVAAMKTLIYIYSAVIAKIEFMVDHNLTAWLRKARETHRSLNYFITKEIITKNLYGVDIMEEATEIAKLRLFLSLVSCAHDVSELEPLPNIDFNIMAGNSLIGLMQVNDADYDSRRGQLDLFSKTYSQLLDEKNRLIATYRNATTYSEDLQTLRDKITTQKAESLLTLDEILLGEFKALKIKYEQAQLTGKAKKRELTLTDIKALQPFHWGYEFDDILQQRGGFDAIITNPPWEIFKPYAREFFVQHNELVIKSKMDIKDFEKEQKKLLQNPEIANAWLEYQSQYPYVSAYYRSSEQYKNQISIVNGKKAGTDINLYKLFLEQCFNLLRPNGECGIIVPSGIYTDLGTKQLREMLFSQTNITELFGLSNERFIFEGVDHRFKVCLLTFEKGRDTDSFMAAFRIDPREAIRVNQLDTFFNNQDEQV